MTAASGVGLAGCCELMLEVACTTTNMQEAPRRKAIRCESFSVAILAMSGAVFKVISQHFLYFAPKSSVII